MEEKERYTIESFEVDEPSCIFDNKTQQRILTLIEYNYDEIVNLEKLLNQCDKRIKELEEQVENYRKGVVVTATEKINKLLGKNQQLKQQLHELSQDIFGEIKKKSFKCYAPEDKKKITEYILDSQTFDTILEKYGVQNENNKK